MTSYVWDQEWCVAEGADIVLDAEYIHCAVFKELGKENYHEFTNPVKLRKWLQAESNNSLTLIGHNIMNADLEVNRRLLDAPFTIGPDTMFGNPCTFIDTFTLSKRLNPDRTAVYIYDHSKGKKVSLGIHGLAAWAYRCGSKKIAVDDWTTQDVSVYLERCKGDVQDNELAYCAMLEERL